MANQGWAPPGRIDAIWFWLRVRALSAIRTVTDWRGTPRCWPVGSQLVDAPVVAHIRVPLWEDGRADDATTSERLTTRKDSVVSYPRVATRTALPGPSRTFGVHRLPVDNTQAPGRSIPYFHNAAIPTWTYQLGSVLTMVPDRRRLNC